MFISYGSRTNDLLLQRYGFVEADNPDDVYCITGFLDKVRASPVRLKSLRDKDRSIVDVGRNFGLSSVVRS